LHHAEPGRHCSITTAKTASQQTTTAQHHHTITTQVHGTGYLATANDSNASEATESSSSSADSGAVYADADHAGQMW
jgi:hypothetical protein